MKRSVSVLLVLVLLLSLMPSAFAAGRRTVTLKTAPELRCALRSDLGPINITKAVLNRDGTSEDIYLVLLSGVRSPLVNPNNIASCVTSFLSAPSPYLEKLYSVCKEQIPEGSKIVFSAHSLGGMVAQQFAATPSMKERYEILNITAYGSPLVAAIGREGSLHRLVDTSDPVAQISLLLVYNSLSEVSYEDGGYRFAPSSAHTKSYSRSDVWGGYDCFGVKGGNASITYDPADMYIYPNSKYTLILF